MRSFRALDRRLKALEAIRPAASTELEEMDCTDRQLQALEIVRASWNPEDYGFLPCGVREMPHEAAYAFSTIITGRRTEFYGIEIYAGEEEAREAWLARDARSVNVRIP